MSESTDSTSVPVDENQPEKPKKKRFWWYLQFPFWFLCFCMWFGFDTLLLRNVPLLLMLIFVFSGLYLINKGTIRWFDPPPKRRTWRLAKLIFVQMFASFAFLFSNLCVMRYWVPPVAISKQTTHITSPLTADGMEIDDVRAIEERFAPKGNPEDNGFRTVVRLFGPDQVFDIAPKHREEYASQLCKQLDIDQNEPPELKFQDISDFFRKQIGQQDLPAEDKTEKVVREKSWTLVRKMLEKPWKSSDFEGSDAWLHENADALDRFGEAVRMPYYYAPPLALPRAVLIFDRCCIEADFHRNIVRSLQCRIMYSLAEGDVDKAFYDAESILRLANMQIRHPVSTTQLLMTRAIQGVGFLSVRRILEFGDLSKEQAEKLRNLFRAYRTEASLEDLVFLTRFDGMNGLYYMASSRAFEGDLLPKENSNFARHVGTFCFAGFRYFGWNSVFTKYQQRIDTLETIAKGTPSKNQFDTLIHWADDRQAIKIFDGEPTWPKMLKTFFWNGIYQVMPQTMGEILIDLSTTALSGGIQSCYQGIVQMRQTDLAIALELYHFDHDAYPKELMELKSGYLDEIPDDPFTDGEPFHYAPNITDGRITGYTLYSVGPNGVDDGGFNKYDKCPEMDGDDETRDGDDIRIFLFRDKK